MPNKPYTKEVFDSEGIKELCSVLYDNAKFLYHDIRFKTSKDRCEHYIKHYLKHKPFQKDLYITLSAISQEYERCLSADKSLILNKLHVKLDKLEEQLQKRNNHCGLFQTNNVKLESTRDSIKAILATLNPPRKELGLKI